MFHDIDIDDIDILLHFSLPQTISSVADGKWR